MDTHESQGLRQKEELRFVELEDWKKANPGKVPPAAAIDRLPVLQKDGTTAIKEGVLESLMPAGEHRFERYSDRGVTTKRNVHNSARASLGEGNAEAVHEAATSQLRIARPLSLEELAGLTVTEQVDAKSDSSEGHGDDSDDGVDDDRAARQCSEKARPLFSFREVTQPKAQSKPKAAPASASACVSTPASASRHSSSAVPAGKHPVSSPVNNPASRGPASNNGSAHDADLEEDLDVPVIDGRAEKMKRNLRQEIAPLLDKLNSAKTFTAIDVEHFLGFGDIFKNALRHWQKVAKDIERAYKVVQRRIDTSTRPSVYSDETADILKVATSCDAIVELTRTMLSTQAFVISVVLCCGCCRSSVSLFCAVVLSGVFDVMQICIASPHYNFSKASVDEFSQALQTCEDNDFDLSITFYVFQIWKNSEQLAMTEDFTDLCNFFTKNNPRMVALETMVAGVHTLFFNCQ